MHKKETKLRFLEKVYFDFDSLPISCRDEYPEEFGQPIEDDSRPKSLLFMGEIPNMPGHCAVISKTGKILWGYHTDNFKTMPEDW